MKPAAIAAIDRAIADDALFVSVISAWEIGMLQSKGRLELWMDCERWVNHALRMHGTQLANLTTEIAVQSNYLPGKFHADPADRILVATARAYDMPLVTKDQRILAYAKHKHVRVLSA
jgi:PIN domain nuclease of toxin-antitoxin system